MIQQFLKGRFNITMHIKMFKQLLKCILAVSLVVYGGIRVIFFDIPFEWQEELQLIGKMLLTATLFALAISSTLLAADAVQYLINKARSLQPVFVIKRVAILMLLLTIIATACNAQSNFAGTVKDNGTGLTASYKNIKPEKVLLIMNNEIIQHTDVPIGESFLLVNKGIKGLVIKAGKISVGCSMVIKDKKGKIVMSNEDLFKGKDIMNKTTDLSCTVSTPNSIKWEEKYVVTVIFWDKYGSGRIENKVTIRAIDIP